MELPEILGKRETIEREAIDESKLASDPFSQLGDWLVDASQNGESEVNAVALATATGEGTPSVRIVLLRKLSEKGLVFFTNYQSRKGRELEQNPKASMCFFWSTTDRQVRLDGTVSKCDPAESMSYFQSRPLASQVSAWASAQSTIIESRLVLENKVSEIRQKFSVNEKLPLPPHWGGFLFVPYQFEFWQGRKDRLHDRIIYRREGKSWVRERLAP